MKPEALHDLTLGVLVHASQMAYVEEAAGTSALLENFTPLYRYLTAEEQQTLLEEELKLLQNYIELQQLRYAGKVEIQLDLSSATGGMYLQSGKLLEFVHTEMQTVLEEMDEPIQILIHIEKPAMVQLTVTQGGNQILHHKEVELLHV